MGREALCHCQWADKQGEYKVLLEAGEVLLRGAFRKRFPISALTNVRQNGDLLTFQAGKDAVRMRFGSDLAQRWLKAMATPPSDSREEAWHLQHEPVDAAGHGEL
jgi:hypothetical protein